MHQIVKRSKFVRQPFLRRDAMRHIIKILVSATTLGTIAAFLPPFAVSEQAATAPVPAIEQPSAGTANSYTTELITSSDMYNKLPRINNSGSLVWQAKVGDHFQIFYKAVTSEAPIQLTNNALDNTDPRINDQDEIVWMGGDKNHSEIFLYAKGGVTQLTETTLANRHPKLNNNGEVVWIAGSADSDGKVEEFEAFHYVDGVITQVTDNNKFNVQVRINDAGTMMWRGKGETDFDIFMRTDGAITQVTVDGGEEMNPQISSGGNMVW